VGKRKFADIVFSSATSWRAKGGKKKKIGRGIGEKGGDTE